MSALDKLTPEDWGALAAVPEGVVYIYGNDDLLDRLLVAGVVSVEGSCVHREITRFGHGVIAAARVLATRPRS